MKKKQLKQYANIAIKYLAAIPIYFLTTRFQVTASGNLNVLKIRWEKKKFNLLCRTIVIKTAVS
jgi:hypothetical protein